MDAIYAAHRASWAGHLAQLDDLGYTVVPDVLPTALTVRVRSAMDALLLPPQPDGSRVSKVHPIPGSIMAELAAAPSLLSMAGAFYGCDPLELRLGEQVMIRSDPPPAADHPAARPGAMGWHTDFIFPPGSYEATPRRTYFQFFLHMNTVHPGCAAFMIVPGSHKRTLAVAKKLTTREERAAVRANLSASLGLNLDKDGIEVCANEGDAIVFNPMCAHSGSRHQFCDGAARYVVVCSFNHCSAATYLQSETRRIRYLHDWHPDLYKHMPQDLLPILASESLWGRYERPQLDQFSRTGWALFGPADQLLPVPTRSLVATALRAAGSASDGIGESETLLFLSLLKEVGEPLFAAIEDQAAAALARMLLQIDPNINTGPHGHAAHIVVRSFGARSATVVAPQPPINPHRAKAEVEFFHRLDLASEDKTLVWCPRRLGRDANRCPTQAGIWWDYRPRAAPQTSAIKLDDVKRLVQVEAVFGDEWQKWPTSRKQLWGLPDERQSNIAARL